MKTVLALAMLILLIGCTSYQEATAPPVEDLGKTIVISDYRFHPERTSVANGTKVTWKNLDADAHSLWYNGTESKELKQTETFSIIAEAPGTYEYHSGNHPFIKGVLIVTEAQNSSES